MNVIQKFVSQALRAMADRRRRRVLLSVLAVVVVVGVGWTLRLSGIALNGKVICGLDEHTHSESCYTQEQSRLPLCTYDSLGVHEHSEECRDEEDNLICGMADFLVHTHTPMCMDESRVLRCVLPQIEAHTHNELCYTAVQVEADHVHGDSCYGPGEGQELICQEAEYAGHTHGAECYTAQNTRQCGLQETPGHTHHDGCLTIYEEPQCGQDLPHTHHSGCDTRYDTPQCGLEEGQTHTHTDSCFLLRTCGMEETPGHAHTDSCYQVRTCGMEECGPHTHSDDCFLTLTCQEPETPGHTHGDGCYTAARGDLICTIVATQEEADAARTLTCGQEEIKLHTHDEKECYEYPLICAQSHDHTDQCYDTVLICKELELLEHNHGVACFPQVDLLTCGQQEHTHTGECAPTEPEVVRTAFCGYQEHTHTEGCSHTHTDQCYEWVTPEASPCEITDQGHTHDDTCTPKEKGQLICTTEAGALVCTLTEHAHEDSCFQEPEEVQPQSLTFQADSYSVRVTFSAEEVVPEDAKLNVRPLAADSEEYQTLTAQTLALLADRQEISKAGFLEITLLSGETPFLPEGPVSVEITCFQVLDQIPAILSYANGSEGLVPLTIQAEASEEGLLRLTYTQDGFTLAGFVTTQEAPALQAPEGLNVDYFLYVDGQWEQVGTTTAGWLGETPQQPENAAPSQPQTLELEAAGTEPGQSQQEADQPDTLDLTEEDFESSGASLTQGQTQEPGTPEAPEVPEAPVSTPDALPLSQVVSVLGDYGFTSDKLLTLAIQPKAQDIQAPNSLFTVSDTLDMEGNVCLPLNVNPRGYNIYFLPVNETALSGASLDQLDTANNAFFSVTVVDPEGLIYADEAELPEKLILPRGGQGEILVRNAPDVLWIVEGSEAKTETLSFGSVTTMALDAEGEGEAQEVTGTLVTLADIDATTQVRAVTANPKFTVQYHAYLNVGSDSDYSGRGWEETKLIDTRHPTNPGENMGGNLPQGGRANPVVTLYIDPATSRFPLEMAKLTPVLLAKEFQFVESPGLKFVNQMKDNKNYSFMELWKLKPGADPNSTAPEDWQVFTNVTDLAFQNDPNHPSVLEGTSVFIEEGTVLRLVYNPVQGSFSTEATFYDYDITDGEIYSNSGFTATYGTQPMYGKNGTSTGGKIVYFKTNKQGINSNSNYSGKSGSRLGFGNNNTNSGMADNMFGNQYMNKYNLNNTHKDEHGCTYGLVTGLNADGTVRYASGVAAPNLFNDGAAIGKTTFPGYSLNFFRNGDTYTLTSVNDASGKTVASNLMGLNQYGSGDNMPSNNFWPMDHVSYWKAGSGMSPGHDPAFGDDTSYSNGTTTVRGSWRRWGAGIWNGMPFSDDLVDHNSYFGMNFAVSFSLTPDYIGPLEYTFYGDDDLWIFLTHPDGTSELICDIGGVHTSMGEYVDLWDYIQKSFPEKGIEGESGLFKLTGFYTERGASGSTCWMNFTLPSVSSIDLTDETGNLEITKQTEDLEGNPVPCTDLFEFQVELRTSENGMLLPDRFSYPCRITNADGTTYKDTVISAGGTVSLYAGQKAMISGLPGGTFYRVTELNRGGYHTTVNGNYGYIVAGNVHSGVQTAAFINIPGQNLPNTGASGAASYVFWGLLLTAAPLKYVHHRKSRGRRQRQ